MLFSTPFFVFLFLPVFFVVYWFLPARAWVLLLGSLVFYGWSEPVFLWVVVLSTWIDWLLGKRIVEGQPKRKPWLVAGLVANLALLFYAKYTVFAFENLNGLLNAFDWRSLAVPKIALPLGVSFIVFEKITYLVDVYRGTAKPSESFLSYLNYVFLFPKLLAGPIVKYHDIAAQLNQPTHRYEDVRDGVIRFLTGLGKKVLLADLLAPVADKAFDLPATALDPATAWLGLVCFTLQIYFDFSGYSDMAIGMGRILGFRLAENFRDPYLATSVTDFWKRWHISLSTWIRDYLYFPLCGKRPSPARSYASLSACFVLCGLWHGAAWHFVIFGCYHGLILVWDRAFGLELQKRLPRFVNMSLTLFLVMMSFIIFRCASVGQALQYWAALAGSQAVAGNAVFLEHDTMTALCASLALVFAPLARSHPGEKPLSPHRAPALLWACVLLLLCAGKMSVSTFHPFLYFQF
jgi:alginate O-acetyltransferase complex protein AlgI